MTEPGVTTLSDVICPMQQMLYMEFWNKPKIIIYPDTSSRGLFTLIMPNAANLKYHLDCLPIFVVIQKHFINYNVKVAVSN